MGIVEDLERARAAFERRDWAAAYDRLSGIADLGPADLLALGSAAYLVGDADECIRAFQRGYHAAVRDDDAVRAIRFAFWLALVHHLRGEQAISGGWTGRARRLLTDRPGDSVEHAYLLVHEFYGFLGAQDVAGAMRAAVGITEAGRRFGDPDLLAQGLMCQGRLLLYGGRVAEGLALLDESMVGVSAGEVSPVIAGTVYCAMVEACQEIADLTRAATWTSALTRWCDTQPDLVPFTGQCAVHRGQILRLHGAFEGALAEFDLACRRYAESGAPAAAGLALTEQGDVLRIRGDYPAAEAAYELASSHGHEPQPGLSLLWSARGRTAAAVGAIRRLLVETVDPVHRSRLLPAAVEILVAADRLDEAGAAAAELDETATAFGCDGLLAMAGYGVALSLLAAGDPEAALRRARRSRQLWTTLEAPYETARARVVIGRALRDLGDEDSATGELGTAASEFTRLGAAPAARETGRLLGSDAPGGLTGREIEVLRLVAAGHSNTEVARRLVLSEKTIARHLSNIFTKIDVSSRTAAVAYAHEQDLL